ncbi:unnamed protein product [Citrullus colocynthis]|uniref:Uncharacterized protein n=1 Tax=Citrullus colocynthis TaxID=252529 RepID=A0ABP0YL88_9ROSI
MLLRRHNTSSSTDPLAASPSGSAAEPPPRPVTNAPSHHVPPTHPRITRPLPATTMTSAHCQLRSTLRSLGWPLKCFQNIEAMLKRDSSVEFRIRQTAQHSAVGCIELSMVERKSFAEKSMSVKQSCLLPDTATEEL